MFGNNNKPTLVGAKAKREAAKNFDPAYQIKSKREGKAPSAIVPVAAIYAISVIFAMILTEGPMKAGLGIHTGHTGFDQAMFGPGIPTFTGSAETDRGIAIFLRGTMIFLLGGILPALTWAWQKLVDSSRMNVYLSFWCVSTGAGLVYYLARDTVGPALIRVLDIFT